RFPSADTDSSAKSAANSKWTVTVGHVVVANICCPALESGALAQCQHRRVSPSSGSVMAASWLLRSARVRTDAGQPAPRGLGGVAERSARQAALLGRGATVLNRPFLKGEQTI